MQRSAHPRVDAILKTFVCNNTCCMCIVCCGFFFEAGKPVTFMFLILLLLLLHLCCCSYLCSRTQVPICMFKSSMNVFRSILYFSRTRLLLRQRKRHTKKNVTPLFRRTIDCHRDRLSAIDGNYGFFFIIISLFLFCSRATA